MEFILKSSDVFYTQTLQHQRKNLRAFKKCYVFNKETPENYTIIYAENGNYDVLSEGKIATLETGDMFLCKPYQNFYIIPLDINSLKSFRTIDIHPSVFESQDKETKIFRAFESRNRGEFCVYKCEELSEVHQLFEKILSYGNRTFPQDAFKAVFLLILLELCDIYDKTNNYIPARFSHEYDLRVYSYIQSRALTKIKIDDVMSEFFLSSFHVNKICKKFYNMGFSDMIKDTRMWAARGFMTSKKANELHEIAKLCGYTDYSAFFKAYKGFFGIGPKEDFMYYKETNSFYRKK